MADTQIKANAWNDIWSEMRQKRLSSTNTSSTQSMGDSHYGQDDFYVSERNKLSSLSEFAPRHIDILLAYEKHLNAALKNSYEINVQDPNDLDDSDSYKFHSVLLKGPTGSGLSTILLRNVLRKLQDGEKVIYLVDNHAEAEYYSSLLDYLKTKDSTDIKTAYVSGRNGGRSIKPSDYEDYNVLFVSKQALSSNTTDISKIMTRFKISTVYCDDARNLHERFTPITSLMKSLKEYGEDQTLELIAALNDSFYENRNDEIIANPSFRIDDLFPGEIIQMASRDELGMPALDQDRFHSIMFPEINLAARTYTQGTEDGTEDVLNREISAFLSDPTSKPGGNDYFNYLLDELTENLEGKRTIIKTTSDTAATKIAEALNKRGFEAFSFTADKTNSSLKSFLNGSYTGKHKFLCTGGRMKNLHLPKGSYDNFVYLNTTTNATRLAKHLSVATSDPDVDIYFLDFKKRPSFCAFPDGDRRDYKPRFSVSSRSRTTKTRVLSEEFEAQFLPALFESTKINENTEWLEVLRQLFSIQDPDNLDSNENDSDFSKVINDFITKRLHIDSELTSEDLMSVITGEDQNNPYIFRSFVYELFKNKSIRNKLVANFNRNKDDLGWDKLSTAEIIKRFPRLTGINNIHEARVVFADLFPESDFHLGIFLNSFDFQHLSTNQKLEILEQLFSYVHINKASLVTEIFDAPSAFLPIIDSKLSESKVFADIENEGLLPQIAEKILNELVNLKLIQSIFPRLKSISKNFLIEIKDEAANNIFAYEVKINIDDKKAAFNFEQVDLKQGKENVE